MWAATVLAPLFAVGAEEPAVPLTVMSYNLRYASAVPPNAWPTRRPLVAERIRRHQPDLLGTQEGLYHQLLDLEADLPEYAWLGLGREGGSRGEFMAIYYRKDRFTPVAYDHYWLSDTPGVIGSATWGNSVRRMVTWIRLREKESKREFYFVNTHFDHQSQPAREKSAKLVLQRCLSLSEKAPLILVGDFNAAAGKNPAYSTLVNSGGLTDAWNAAAKRSEQTQSFNGFHYPASKEGARIDWILYRGPFSTSEIEIDGFAQGKQYPSDHFPVIAKLTLRPGD
jgi:endonuclease/exonuclease/phosphatase family metal-dependent hydrolase